MGPPLTGWVARVVAVACGAGFALVQGKVVEAEELGAGALEGVVVDLVA